MMARAHAVAGIHAAHIRLLSGRLPSEFDGIHPLAPFASLNDDIQLVLLVRRRIAFKLNDELMRQADDGLGGVFSSCPVRA